MLEISLVDLVTPLMQLDSQIFGCILTAVDMQVQRVRCHNVNGTYIHVSMHNIILLLLKICYTYLFDYNINGNILKLWHSTVCTIPVASPVQCS